MAAWDALAAAIEAAIDNTRAEPGLTDVTGPPFWSNEMAQALYSFGVGGQLGFLVNNGYEKSGNNLIIRPLVVDVAGVTVVKTADTTLTNALSAITVSGWYGVAVDQDGAVTVEGSPGTPLTEANTIRPTGINFETYDEAKQGYYVSGTKRYLMALYINAGTNAVDFAIRLGHGSDEVGNNAYGDWSIANRWMAAHVTSASTLTNNATGNIWRSAAATINWPVAFSVAPTHVRPGASIDTTGMSWLSILSISATQVTMYVVGSLATSRGVREATGFGVPTHLA